ncbi:hypothetical protein K1719_039891 [Acacia pycnantha]|nr:hypothetical protein K1719_039891 [Acacia pycnantha]
MNLQQVLTESNLTLIKTKAKAFEYVPTSPNLTISLSDNEGNSNHLKDNFLHSQEVVEIWDALPTFVAETDRGETTKKLKKEHFQTIKRKWQTTSSSKTMDAGRQEFRTRIEDAGTSRASLLFRHHSLK